MNIGDIVICVVEPNTRRAVGYPAIVVKVHFASALDLCVFNPDPGGFRNVPRAKHDGLQVEAPSTAQQAAAWEPLPDYCTCDTAHNGPCPKE